MHQQSSPRITLDVVRASLDNAIVTRGWFADGDAAVYELLDEYGYEAASSVAWERAPNPLYSVALVLAYESSTDRLVRVPILELALYTEIACLACARTRKGVVHHGRS